MKYFFSAGEHSGDMHAAAVIRHIKELDSEARFWGMGGPLMAREGAEILYDPTKISTIGFWEAVKNYSRFKKHLQEFSGFFRKNRPDVIVWVDFGGFNVRLAEKAYAFGIPVVCIFPPTAWAYGRSRAARLAKSVTHIVSVLPFEADFYRKYGLKVTYIGHPLLDKVKTSIPPATWRKEKGVQEGEMVVALLPGSRLQEVRSLLPIMLEAADYLEKHREGLKFFLPVAPTIDRRVIMEHLSSFPKNLELIDSDQGYNLMAAADFGVITSGTSTLEAAILGLPIIMIYRVSPLSAFIYRRLANSEYKDGQVMIALPNLVAGEMIIPELVQEDLTVESLTAEMLKLYDNYNNTRVTIANELGKVREKLGTPGVMQRAAQLIVAEAQTR
ncbi:MAG TPA: lipid-A-disaccharide synthase [Firmicutes bacterium]|nr:lipid-A-disaccharide synthase [Bacillota bacterium]